MSGCNLNPTPAEADERDDRLLGQVIRKADFIDIVRELSQLSASRAATAIIVQWIVITAVSAFAILSRNPGAFVVAAFVIATRQHALAVLMHDAAHYRLSANRRINDFLSNSFLAFPLGLSTAMYRRWHFSHHRHVGSPLDPEQQYSAADPDVWQWPSSRLKVVRVVAFDLFGIHAMKFVRLVQPWSPTLQLFARKGTIYKAAVPKQDAILHAAMYVAGLCLVIAWPVNSILFALLWYIPMFTLTLTIVRIRSIAEHIAVEGTHELNSTRTVIPAWFERFLISPFNVNFHLEHHMFPSVPWYNLARLHNYLLEDQTFQDQAHITKTYLDSERGLLGEIICSSRYAAQVPNSSRARH